MIPTMHVTSSTPYADGRHFGAVGAYERIDGTLEYAVDPSDPANQAIVDLDLAETGEDGLVRFEGDVVVLRPRDLSKGSGRVLVEAVNRGRRLVPGILNRAGEPNIVDPVIPEGDGFLFRHGFTVVFLGWQWDVFRDDVMMGLDAPRAREGGQDVRGRTILEIRPNKRERTRLLANRLHRPLPVHDLDEADALLTVRDWEDDEPRVLPRDAWAFVQETENGDVPSRQHVTLFDGFEAGRQYHVIYTADEAPIAGCGLLALRDGAAFLRSDAPTNPVAGHVERVHAFGMSQSGRLLRHFVYLGLNRTPEGDAAYDGLLSHVAGSRRGEFNHRFAQPSVQLTPSFGHRYPFTDDEYEDAFGAGVDGLLTRQRELGQVPRIIYTNTSAEYWRGDGSLLHTDPAGRHDIELPEEVRAYAIASTQHGPGVVPQFDVNANDGGHGRYGFNTVDYTPVIRATLLHLDAWTDDGTLPPPTCVPTLDEGTAVARRDVLASFAEVPGLHLPDPDRLPILRTVDLGPDADRGIVRQPIVEGETYTAYVSAVDRDGNERSGVRLPDVTVPLATHTGWNPRHPTVGAEEQIIPMQGFSWFFASTAAEASEKGDVREPLEKRYSGRGDFLARVREAGEALAADGYVLDEDVDVLLDDAAARWDYVASGEAEPFQPPARR